MAGLARRLRGLISANNSASDADLLDRFVTDRDGLAFAALVSRHGPMVLAVCQRVLRHRQDTEDAFQATFLVLARRAEAVKIPALLGSWLYGVAYRTARGARRVARARRARETKAAIRVEDAAPNDGITPELREALDRELATLPDVYRAALVACDLEGLSRREAAGRLGWTEGTLSSRLARARSLLARRLSRYGLAVPVVGLVTVTGLPAVANELADPTIRLGILVATGDAIVAPPVAALMEGMMRTMFMTKLKVVAALFVVAGAVTVSALAGWRADAVGAADSPKVADAPKANDTPKRVALNSDKERIAELERERDQLRKQVAELQDQMLFAKRMGEAVQAQKEQAIEAAKQSKLAAERAVIAEREAVLRARDTARTPPVPEPNTPLPKPGSTPPSPAPLPLVPNVPVPAGVPQPGTTSKAIVRVYQVGGLAADEKEGDALAKVLRAAVEPKSWGTDTGAEYLPGRKVLVVRQTPKVHDEIEELLKLLLKKAPAPPGGK